MTEQERAATLADEIDGKRAFLIDSDGCLIQNTSGLLSSALRLYARSDVAELRKAIQNAIDETADIYSDSVASYVMNTSEVADAILSLLPQTAFFDTRRNSHD